MKFYLGVTVITFLGLVIFGGLNTGLKSNEYMVVMEFTSGNTIGFSKPFKSFDNCMNSAEYKLHTFASGESGAKIYCSNKLPTY